MYYPVQISKGIQNRLYLGVRKLPLPVCYAKPFFEIISMVDYERQKGYKASHARGVS